VSGAGGTVSSQLRAPQLMGGVPLVETAGWIGGVIGASAATFVVVSFLQVKDRYEGSSAWDPAPTPPPSKSAPALAAPQARPATLGRPLKARKAGKKGGK